MRQTRDGVPIEFPIYWVPQRVGRSKFDVLLEWSSVCFQFIGFPSEWGATIKQALGYSKCMVVSNLLGSPASGEHCNPRDHRLPGGVSNLLGSPASGEAGSTTDLLTLAAASFQFIGFPNEWGVVCARPATVCRSSFQFIGFPNEWGGGGTRSLFSCSQPHSVSNLLGSPTSGEFLEQTWWPLPIPTASFQFIGFPNEWGDYKN